MPAAEIGRIMKKITEVFELEKDVEVTLEANPDTLSRAYLDQLVVAGINRISIGMQSAVPHVLSALDRTISWPFVPDA